MARQYLEGLECWGQMKKGALLSSHPLSKHLKVMDGVLHILFVLQLDDIVLWIARMSSRGRKINFCRLFRPTSPSLRPSTC